MHRRFSSTLSLIAVLALVSSTGAQAADPAEAKPIKTLITSVRFERDLAALKQLDADSQGKVLMGDAWEKGTEAQRKEFKELFHTIFAKVAFPNLRDNLKHLSTVTYGNPAADAKGTKVDSTLVIMHPLKKQELKTQYTLSKGAGGYKVVDVLIVGQKESMLEDIRKREIVPRLEKGGWEEVLKVMREFSKKYENVKLK